VYRADVDETRASARLPYLNLDIVHRRARDGAAEQISITLQATPSVEAFTQFLQTANPFQFWGRVWQMVWQPWLAALKAAPPDRLDHLGKSAQSWRLEGRKADASPSSGGA